MRPFGITLLALLAALAGIIASFHTLQYLHIIPIVFGPVSFFTFDLLGAMLWGLTAVIWAWLTVNLWLVRPQALQFVTIFAGLSLILDAISVLGASTLSAMAPSILIYGIILIYSMTPRVREAFGQL